jgi:hypothetical protein
MTFQDKVYEYFKVGKLYRYYNGEIMVCIGFNKNEKCSGYKCLKHHFFGTCDGSISPIFKTLKMPEKNNCAYCSDGTDWFTIAESSNIRW